MMPAHPPFSAVNGLLLILAYGLCAFALTWLSIKGRVASKLEFLLADRNLGVWPAAFSIAATWIWAPALFLASEKAYTQGLAGVFWFIAPNVACLLLFAPLPPVFAGWHLMDLPCPPICVSVIHVGYRSSISSSWSG